MRISVLAFVIVSLASALSARAVNYDLTGITWICSPEWGRFSFDAQTSPQGKYYSAKVHINGKVSFVTTKPGGNSSKGLYGTWQVDTQNFRYQVKPSQSEGDFWVRSIHRGNGLLIFWKYKGQKTWPKKKITCKKYIREGP